MHTGLRLIAQLTCFLIQARITFPEVVWPTVTWAHAISVKNQENAPLRRVQKPV